MASLRMEAKDPAVRELVTSMDKQKAPVWKDLAGKLSKPRKSRAAVNVDKLGRLSGKGDIIAVPGKVLGDGFIDHAITVGALGFSESARSKIEKAGGEAISLAELLEKNPEGKKIRIVM
jgi:large subunit ribosomal protein L18e